MNSFSVEWQGLPKNMRILSLCLRSLYVEIAVDSYASNATDINSIRDQTRQDAIVFVKGIMPLSTQVLRCIREFFEHFEELELEEWKECLPDILEEVTGYQQCCTEIVRMHEEMMVPLKNRQDEAKKLIFKLKYFKEEQTRYVCLIEESTFSMGRSIRLVIDKIVGAINSIPLFNTSAEASAVAEGQQFNNNKTAIMIVSDVLIPALSAFLDGLNAIAGLFNVMKEELTYFQNKGRRAVEGTKRLHYIMMRKKAVEITGSCREFYAMIPGVRTDLQCIPEMPDDMNYVDKWLIRQQEEIKSKYLQTITGPLSKLLNLPNQPRRSKACD